MQEVYGPFEEIPFKLRDKFRYSLIIKAKNRVNCHKVLKKTIDDFHVSSSMRLVAILH